MMVVMPRLRTPHVKTGYPTSELKDQMIEIMSQ